MNTLVVHTMQLNTYGIYSCMPLCLCGNQLCRVSESGEGHLGSRYLVLPNV